MHIDFSQPPETKSISKFRDPEELSSFFSLPSTATESSLILTKNSNHIFSAGKQQKHHTSHTTPPSSKTEVVYEQKRRPAKATAATKKITDQQRTGSLSSGK